MVKKYLRKLMRWALSSDGNAPQPEDVTSYHGSKVTSLPSNSLGERNNGMNFTVYNATGGKIVQFSTYDPSRDRHQTNLYIITEKEDMGEELAHIITRESLTR